MSIKSFRSKWERVIEHSNLARSLEDASKLSGDDFDRAYRTALGYLQEQYNDGINGAVIQALPFGNREGLAAILNQRFSDYQTRTLKSAVKDVKGIADGLGDKLKSVALSLTPIKSYDATKQYDLENLVSSYRNRAELARRNIQRIDPNDPAYKEQEKLIREQEERASLLSDYKGLVKSITAYKRLESNLTDKDGPNEGEMQDLCLRYLSGVVGSFGNDKNKLKDNIPLIADMQKLLVEDSKFLQQYYESKVLRPARKKYEAEVKKYDLKDYIARNVGIMDTKEQSNFFNTVYSISKSEEIKKNLAGTYKEQFGIPEKSAFKKAA